MPSIINFGKHLKTWYTPHTNKKQNVGRRRSVSGLRVGSEHFPSTPSRQRFIYNKSPIESSQRPCQRAKQPKSIPLDISPCRPFTKHPSKFIFVYLVVPTEPPSSIFRLTSPPWNRAGKTEIGCTHISPSPPILLFASQPLTFSALSPDAVRNARFPINKCCSCVEIQFS